MSQVELIAKDILVQFLEVVFNTIIYYRKIYPDEIFVRKKIYGTPVHITVHPELHEYFKNILIAVKELVVEDPNSIKSICLTIVNKEKVPLESYVFDLLNLNTAGAEKDPYLLKTEEALRTICLKLSMLESYLKPLPQDVSFFIEIVTYETAHVALNENKKCEHFPWIATENKKEMMNKSLLPVKTIQTEHLTLQMYAIEDEISKNEQMN